MKLLNLNYKTSILKKQNLNKKYNHKKKGYISNRNKSKDSIIITIKITIKNIKSINKLIIKKINKNKRNSKNNIEIRLKENANVNKKSTPTLPQ